MSEVLLFQAVSRGACKVPKDWDMITTGTIQTPIPANNMSTWKNRWCAMVFDVVMPPCKPPGLYDGKLVRIVLDVRPERNDTFTRAPKDTKRCPGIAYVASGAPFATTDQQGTTEMRLFLQLSASVATRFAAWEKIATHDLESAQRIHCAHDTFAMSEKTAIGWRARGKDLPENFVGQFMLHVEDLSRFARLIMPDIAVGLQVVSLNEDAAIRLPESVQTWRSNGDIGKLHSEIAKQVDTGLSAFGGKVGHGNGKKMVFVLVEVDPTNMPAAAP